MRQIVAEKSAPASLPPKGARSAVVETAITNVGLAVVSTATGVLAARILGPDARGHLAAAQVIGTLLGALGALSLGESLVYFVGQRRAPARTVLFSAVTIALVSTVALIAAGLILIPWILAGQPDAITPARAYTLIGITFVLLGFPVTFLRAQQRYQAWNLTRLIGPLCWLAALLIVGVGIADGLTTLIIIFIGLQALFVPIVWHLALRGLERHRHVDRQLALPMLRYGAPLFLASLPLALNVRLDQLFLANSVPSADLGRYAVSVTWAAIGIPVMSSIGAILFPRLASETATETPALLARASRAGVILAAVFALASALLAPFLVPLLFGSEFSVPLFIPIALAVASGLLGLNGLLEEGLRGAGEPRSVLIGEALGLAVAVALLIILVPSMGIEGAATASVAGYCLVTVALVVQITRRLGLTTSSLLIPRAADRQAFVDATRGLSQAIWRRRRERI